nr:hypothetical protein [Tanacetum cinerariifolium]
SDEFIKSSVENLVSNPSESEGKHECDVPACDDFITFSNILFDVDDDFSSSDDESFSDEDISKKIYSNPLFGEEILSMKIGIDKADCDPKEEIRLVEKLLYDNSSPRPLEEFNFEDYDAIIEFFSPSPIPVKGSDPFMEEIGLFLASDGSIPPEIPSGESKVHIEVLSVLWENRLPIPDGSLSLSRTPDVSVFKKVEGIPKFEIRLLARSVRTPDVSVV